MCWYVREERAREGWEREGAREGKEGGGEKGQGRARDGKRWQPSKRDFSELTPKKNRP
jgi:hypothetical protein